MDAVTSNPQTTSQTHKPTNNEMPSSNTITACQTPLALAFIVAVGLLLLIRFRDQIAVHRTGATEERRERRRRARAGNAMMRGENGTMGNNGGKGHR